MALNLANDVEVSRAPAGRELTLTVTGEGAAELSDPGRNLLVRALRQTLEAEGLAQLPLVVHQHNRIPLRRGLGSSAAAVVGGVAAGLALSRGAAKVTPAAVLEQAVPFEGHPDNVVPAMVGGLCVCWQATDRNGFDYLDLEPPSGLGAVVCVPAVEVATADARRVLPKTVAHGDAVFAVGRSALLMAALTQGRLDLLKDAMEDRLHQPYRVGLLPAMGQAMEAARAAGAYGACLSGSGSSMLALCPGDDAEMQGRVGEAMAQCFTNDGGAAVLRLRPSRQGAKIVDATVDVEDKENG
jgi:homoserine kinase